MKAIIPDFEKNISKPIYFQLYDHIKNLILKREIVPFEKLPSLRNLSEGLNLSLTTIEQAYNQLAVEGYIYSKPQSGYFVSEMFYPHKDSKEPNSEEVSLDINMNLNEPLLKYDLSCFDFNKWKKCSNKILNEYPHLLMFESDSQGEPALRYEISKYVYRSRGVKCNPEQIVIGAGTQQITSQLSTILKKMAINHVTVEDPGYLPVNNIFRDRGFLITPVNVMKDGININKLPSNISSAVYVNPSNQFPTGAVMPVSKRYQLLDWAKKNNSYIIEDDYDSELRYFGQPVPALQGLDTENSVVYLGSFSSTLFPSIKISYMVLPEKMKNVFLSIKDDYSQTCSKAEQLTLALFMEKGYYQTSIKKIRRLYSNKLQEVLSALSKHPFITPINTSSGINMIIHVKSNQSAEDLCKQACDIGIFMVPVDYYTEDTSSSMVFYYNQLPLETIHTLIDSLAKIWKA